MLLPAQIAIVGRKIQVRYPPVFGALTLTWRLPETGSSNRRREILRYAKRPTERFGQRSCILAVTYGHTLDWLRCDQRNRRT
jgi:hypothetical protein